MLYHVAPWEKIIWLDCCSAEEVKEKRRTLDSACMLPGAIHSDLIPWYTSGYD